MQQDKKLGLALGVLLIGTVAALFFRNERALQDDVPALANPDRIDHLIEDQANRPYVDEMPEAFANGESPEVLADIFPPPQEDVFGSRPPFEQNPPTDPLTNDLDKDLLTSTDGGLYEVQPGDTLSGIAQTFFGRGSRYIDIYEANRDLMRTPDDLRVGMMLKIPNQDQTARRMRPPALSDPDLRGEFAANPDRGTVRDGGWVPLPSETDPEPSHSEFYDGGRTEQARNMPLPRDGFMPLDPTGPPVRYERKPVENRLPPPPVAERETPVDPLPSDIYTVKPGDSLERIAIRKYGDRRAVRKLYEANRDRIERPDRLEIGMRLRLPL